MCSPLREIRQVRTSIFNVTGERDRDTMKKEHYCPSCDETRSFSLMASEKMYLGKKTKWWCEECGFEMVLIDNTVDTARAQA